MVGRRSPIAPPGSNFHGRYFPEGIQPKRKIQPPGGFGEPALPDRIIRQMVGRDRRSRRLVRTSMADTFPQGYNPKVQPPGGVGEPALPAVLFHKKCLIVLTYFKTVIFMKDYLPVRKYLNHEVPHWVGDGAVYFVTINCQMRGINHLCNETVSSNIRASLIHRIQLGYWWPYLFLVMPDHCHGLISFHNNKGLKKEVTNWKRYCARQNKLKWQRDFFDHRIRNNAEFQEKQQYIYNNPIKAGLISDQEVWPYVWDINGLIQ